MAAPAIQPAFLGVAQLQIFWGGLSRTSIYELFKKYHVQTIKIIGRTAVPFPEAQRVVEAILADQVTNKKVDTTRATAASLAVRASPSKRRSRPKAANRAAAKSTQADVAAVMAARQKRRSAPG